jgi:hypothetical protein
MLDPKESPLVDGENSTVTNSPLSDLADSAPFILLLADHALERQKVSI